MPGVNAGLAVLIAVGFTALGAGIDAARGTELTKVFSVAYIVGCVVAVLAVRQRGLFTAAVQPPLILFITVPLAYQYMTKGGGTGMKEIALNDAVPLVNRFPLMATATVSVLVIAGLRWLLGRSQGAVERARATRASRAGSRSERKPRSGSGAGRSADRGTRAASRAKAKNGPKDTAKDKLDRIASKAETLKSESIPKNNRGQASGPIPSGRSYDGDRTSGPMRRRPEQPRSDPRYQQQPPEARGGHRRGDVPSHPMPGVRYRDTPPYER